jgi:hypothetical protein
LLKKYETTKIQLTKKLVEEIEMNKKIMQQYCKGQTVNYGEEIQLAAYDSGDFLKVEKTCADIDKASNMCLLSRKGSKDVVFLIQPRYKYRMEGNAVSYGDVVTF